MTQQGCWLMVLRDRLHRALAYFSVLRPSFIFGLIIVYLPLTAAADWVPGNSMLANLFVEYGFWKAFWFSFAFFGAVWALMLTACLSLDLARDRQPADDPWLPNPEQQDRWVTLPMCHKRTFVLFTLLAAPGAAIVLWHAGNPTTVALAFAGLVIGCLLAFFGMSLVAAVMYSEDAHYQVFPWRPFDLKIKWFGTFSRRFLSRTMRALLAPEEIFDKTGYLKDDHFFAALSTVAVVFIYTVIYWLFKPSGIGLPLENIPPAGFIYALFLPLIWIVTALWVYLSRYRLVFLAVIGITCALTWAATRDAIQSRIGGPSHTYDIVPRQSPVKTKDTAAPKERQLIIVAASGGGILAAGWTAHVLTQLHKEYSNFPRELGLISSVSGGSVGAAHYLNVFDEVAKLNSEADRNKALQAVADDAMRSSLASSAYGVAFADFRRVVFPFFADEAFDRARLLEADWRRIANCRKAAIPARDGEEDFQTFCRKQTAELRERKNWISSTQAGDVAKPELIFNSTVMETGERIAITPRATLQSSSPAGSGNVRSVEVARHNHARTLSEFLSAIETSTAPERSKQDGSKPKPQSCSQADFANGYDIDLWTAARLSATFSYVSPAARAACLDPVKSERLAAVSESFGRLHLIDGGYHDNYGVASALDWLTAQQDVNGDLPYTRIAIVEIRAKPDIPTEKAQTEWSSAWLGPFWGLFNSWGFTQGSANDTAVSRMIAHFEDHLRQRKICIASFVFVPTTSGPLSWHLSEAQKQTLRDEWRKGSNPRVLDKLKEFLSAGELAQCRSQ